MARLRHLGHLRAVQLERGRDPSELRTVEGFQLEQGVRDSTIQASCQKPIKARNVVGVDPYHCPHHQR